MLKDTIVDRPVPNRDPAAMTADQRVAEIGAIFATAYLRMKAHQIVGESSLAGGPPHVALCVAPVDAGEETA